MSPDALLPAIFIFYVTIIDSLFFVFFVGLNLSDCSFFVAGGLHNIKKYFM